MRTTAWVFGLTACMAAAGCEDQPQAPLAPEASALEPAKPKASGAVKLEVQKQGSKVEFMMEAPKEKIRGRVADATEGEIYIDPSDITQTTAHLRMDIRGIELYQQVANEDGTFKAEEKHPKQNEHARQWLQIGPDAPAPDLEKNARVQFVIKEVSAEQKDVTKLQGDERKVTATVTGDLLLHGHKTEKTAKLALTFKYKGDKPESVTIETVEPFAVGLAEHDVRPREAFGKLAQKTLDVLSPKVAKEAQVTLLLSAKFVGMAKKDEMATAKKELEGKTASEEPAASAEPAASGETKPAASAPAQP